MRGIEIVDGEACLSRNVDDDDDEKIDLDKDFSYIDRKLENYLGHYQKDFMRGFSAGSLGPILGMYGSFLPVQERYPPILSNQSSQRHVISKSPSNLSSQHFSQNPVVANTTLPARTVPVSSNQRLPVHLQSESGIFAENNQLQVTECASNHQQQTNKPISHCYEQKTLQLKLPSASVMSRDNSALYTGLGLDMSPSSSPEGTPVEKDYGSEGKKLKSPSFIVQIMTSFPLPNEALVSPLHDDLICLMESDNTLETGLPGIGQAKSLNIKHDSAYLDGKIASDEKKTKLTNTAKDKNLMLKEASKMVKPKLNTTMEKPVELVKDAGKLSESTASTAVNKKSDVRCLVAEVDDYAIQGQVGRCEVKEEFGSVLSNGPVVKKGSTIKIRRKSEEGKNVVAVPRDEPGTGKKNEFGCSENDTNKIMRQHIAVKKTKESVKHEKMAIDKGVSVVSEKSVQDGDKHYVIPLEMKHEKSESSKQKPCAPVMPRLKMKPNLKEPPSSLVKKNLKDLQVVNAPFAEPARGSALSSCGAETKDVTRKIISSRDIDLTKEMRKGSEVAVVKNPSKKGKVVSSKGDVMRATERKAQPSANKMERLSGTKTDFANSGSNLGGDGVNVNEFLPPPENSSFVPSEMDDWVQCEECQTWRLLPFGTNPDSLPKEWICRMLTWLPGMNKCSFSEDETTHALRALYLPPASAPALPVQNDQHVHVDGFTPLKPLTGSQNDGRSKPARGSDGILSRSKKQKLTKLEIHGDSPGGSQDLHRSIKKDQQHSGGNKSLKTLKKTSETAYTGNAAAAGTPLKNLKKRIADDEISGVPKKLKKAHQQSVLSSGHAGPPKVNGESKKYKLGAFRISQEFAHGSSDFLSQKVENRGRCAITSIDDEVSDSSEKKKLNDQHPSAGKRPLSNLVSGKNSGTARRKDQKTNALIIKARESSANKEHGRTKGDGRKHNISRVDDNNTLEHHTAEVPAKIADGRKSFKKVPDPGLPQNATSSSSSKISIKLKVKAREVTGSPAGSISSSPLKVCGSDLDKGTKKSVASYIELEELPSKKRRKSRVEGTCSSDEFAPHNEEMKERKSNLSRTACMSDAAHKDQIAKKVPYGGHPTVNRTDAQPKQEDTECQDGKIDPNRLQIDSSTSLDGQELCAADMGDEMEGFEKGCGSMNINNGSEKHSTHCLDDRVYAKPPHETINASKDIGPSSSVKKDSFLWAASALKEARDLKHSANRLKTSGSGCSTGIFFQAALKFLHGASLLEPGNNENGRLGEMSPTEVYSSTAKLCEYCAHEYEKSYDMASAALAYKCMEVAYMRVVYSSDVTASRDRIELQVAVQDAPQVESPSSSASDIDNLNNQVSLDSARGLPTMMDHRTHVISAGNRPNFVRLLSFTHDMNVAMEASRKSQCAFAVANPILLQAGNEVGISSIKRVLDFSFHDVDGLLHLVRLAMEALNN